MEDKPVVRLASVTSRDVDQIEEYLSLIHICLVAAEPAVDSRTVISVVGFIGGQGPSYGSIIIKLKDWEERSMMQSSDIVYGSLFMRAQKIVKDACLLYTSGSLRFVF